MKIEPKKGVLLIKKHKQTALKSKIALQEDDANKNLISGEVIAVGYKKSGGSTQASSDYPPKTTVIFGKYALLSLMLQGVDYYFLDEADVIATCEYKEDV